MAKSIFERLSGEYEQQEDYLIPRLGTQSDAHYPCGHPEKAIFGKDIFFRQVKLNIFLSFFLIRCHA